MLISPYLVAPGLAWLIAQSIKYLLRVRTKGSFSGLKILYQSGNMPSAHSATVSALLMTVGALEGWGSAVTAIAAVFSAVVVYDSLGVRRSSGEQGTALVKLLKKSGLSYRPYVALGHKPTEVSAGLLVGVGSAMIVLSFS